MEIKGNLSKKYPSAKEFEESVINHVKLKGANPHETTAEQVGAAKAEHTHAGATSEKGGFLTPENFLLLLSAVPREELERTLTSYYDKVEMGNNYFNKTEIENKINEVKVVVDEVFSKTSKNAQSGKAVAQAISEEIAKLIGTSGPALDTIEELAAALGNNPDFLNDLLDTIGKKANKDDVYSKAKTEELLNKKANTADVMSEAQAEALINRFKNQINTDVDAKLVASENRINSNLSEATQEIENIANRTDKASSDAKTAAENAANASKQAVESATELKEKLNDVYTKDDTYSGDSINEMFRNASNFEFDIRNFISKKQFMGKLEITKDIIKLSDDLLTMFNIGMKGFKKAEFFAYYGNPTIILRDGTEISLGEEYASEETRFSTDQPFTLQATEACEIRFVNVESDLLEMKNEAKEVLTPIRLADLQQEGSAIVDANTVTFNTSGTHTFFISGFVEFEIDMGIAPGATEGGSVSVDGNIIKSVDGSMDVIENITYKGYVENSISVTRLGGRVTFNKFNNVSYQSGRMKAEDFKNFTYMWEKFPELEGNLDDVEALKVPAIAKYITKTLRLLYNEGNLFLTNATLSRNGITFNGSESAPAKATITISGDIEIKNLYSNNENSSVYLIVDGKTICSIGTQDEPTYFRGSVNSGLSLISTSDEVITFGGIGFREAKGGMLTSEDYGDFLDAAYNQQKHENDMNNPHSITPGKIGAFTKEETIFEVTSAIAKIVDSSPEALDTLQELATALGNDPNFASTVLDLIGKKANSDDVYTRTVVEEKLSTKVTEDRVVAIVDEKIADIPRDEDTKFDTSDVSNALKGHVSGEIVTVNDVSTLERYIKVKCSPGVKVTRCGENLLPYPYYHSTRASGGITFTDNGDGSITLNGTATADNGAIFYFVHHTQLNVNLKDGVTYYAPNLSDKNISFIIQYLDENGTTVYGRSPITWNSAYTLRLIWITVAKAGTSFTNEVIYPYLSTIEDAEYEPYKSEVFTTDADGNVIIPSLYPTTTLFTDVDGVIIEAEYNKDLNKVFGDIDKALDAILAIQEGHAATSVAKEAEGGDEV